MSKKQYERIVMLRDECRQLVAQIKDNDIARHVDSAAVSLDIAAYKLTADSVVPMKAGKK